MIFKKTIIVTFTVVMAVLLTGCGKDEKPLISTAEEESTKESATNSSKPESIIGSESENRSAGDDSNPSFTEIGFENIYNDYAKKMESLSAEYINKLEQAQGGDSERLSNIFNEGIDKLADLSGEGIDKMADISLNNLSEYMEWSTKLTNRYMDETKKITDKYTDIAMSGFDFNF